MSTLTIRKVPETTHAKLRERAARNGRSVEAEVRSILDNAVEDQSTNFLLEMHKIFQPAGGVDLPLPTRTDTMRPVELP